MVGRTTFKITAEGSHDSDDDTFVKIASTTAPLVAILANKMETCSYLAYNILYKMQD